MAFKIFRVGRVGVGRNHLLTEGSVSWTGCCNRCLFLRWEGPEERAAVELCPPPGSPSCRHSQPLPAGGSAAALLWCDSSHPSVPAVELQLEQLESEILFQDLALCLHMYPQKRKRCLKWESRSSAVVNVGLKNDISSWSSDLSTGPEMSMTCHTAWCLAKWFYLFG